MYMAQGKTICAHPHLSFLEQVLWYLWIGRARKPGPRPQHVAVEVFDVRGSGSVGVTSTARFGGCGGGRQPGWLAFWVFGKSSDTMPAIMITNRGFLFSPRIPATHNRDPAKRPPNAGKTTMMISW